MLDICFKNEKPSSGDIFIVESGTDNVYMIIEDVFEEICFLLINLKTSTVIKKSNDYNSLIEGLDIKRIIKHRNIKICEV